MTRTRVKMCGLTRAEDVDTAVQAGADAVGFVFYPPSPRSVDMTTARTLMGRVPPFVTKVALVVNASSERVRELLTLLPVDLLQFHGDESPDFCAQFNRPWLKVARVGAGFDLLEFARRYAGVPGCIGILADAHVESFGGAGKSFDWNLIPPELPLPLILSGGLCPANVQDAIVRVRPWAVDVSSGIEVPGGSKGIKHAHAIEQFMAGVRDADAAR